MLNGIIRSIQITYGIYKLIRLIKEVNPSLWSLRSSCLLCMSTMCRMKNMLLYWVILAYFESHDSLVLTHFSVNLYKWQIRFA